VRALGRISEVLGRGNLDPRLVAEVYYWRGLLHRRLGRTGAATRWLEKALELAPAHTQSHMLLFELYAEADQMTQALFHLVSGLKVDPGQKGIMQRISRLFPGQEA
jgi:lipoprotein NlpI